MKQTPAIESNDKNWGFTLIELMLVITVISILAIVSVPKYQAVTDHYKLESAAQIVVGQLRYAQQLSKDQRKETYLVLEEKTVQVLSDDLDGNLKVFGGVQAWGSGVTFDSSSASANGLTINPSQAQGLPHVKYSARGFVLDSAAKIVLSSVRTGRSVAINVEVYTGNITLVW